ncbi:YhgE/Pip domain protein, partial [Sporosarcina newyorkensis 2681]
MKNILFIVRRDIRNIKRNKAALVVIAALAFLPSLYAWMNILASWDPYSNTKGVSVAVASLDEGATIEDKDFNVGDEVIVSLTKNDDLGWQFVSEEEAIKGVEHGDYYAAIIIPKDFSENLSSVTTDNLVQPKLDYYINEKINAISPKVASKGASAIVENIQSTFVEEANNAVLKVFNNAGIKLENNRANIERMRDIIYDLEENIPEIYSKLNTVDRGLNFADTSIDKVGLALDEVDSVHANAKRLNERLVSKLQDNEKAVESTLNAITTNLESAQNAFRKIPDLTSDLSKKGDDLDRIVNSLRDKQDKLDDVNTRLDEIYDYLKEQDKKMKNSTKIKDLQGSLNESVDDLTQLKKNVQTLITDLKKGENPAVDLIQQTQKLSDKLAEDLDRMSDSYENVLYPQTQKLIEQLTELSGELTGLLDRASKVNQNALKSVQHLIDQRESLDLSGFQDELDRISSSLESNLEKMDTVISLLKVAGNLTGSEKIANLENKFLALQSQLQKTQQIVNAIQAGIDKGETPSLHLLNQLKEQLESTQKRIDDATKQFDSNSQNALAQAVKQLKKLDKEMQERFESLQESKTAIDKKLESSLETAKNPERTIDTLERMARRIDGGITSIQSIDSGLKNLQDFIDSDKVSNEIEHIKTVQGNLTETKSSVDGLIGRIHETKANGKKHLAEIDRMSERMNRSIGDVIEFVNSDLSRKYKSTMRDATNALYDG